MAKAKLIKHVLAACCLFLAQLVLFGQVAQAVTPAGTTISNTAQLHFEIDGNALGVSATHQINTDLVTPNQLSIKHFVPAATQGAQPINVTASQCYRGASLVASPAPRLLYAPPFSGTGSVTTLVGPSFKGGDAVLISVIDYGRNRDPNLTETVIVEVSSANDLERLVLTETGPATGEFAAYLQTTRSQSGRLDCMLTVVNNDQLVARYLDQSSQLLGQASVLIDPLGRVFDAVTGQLINGVRVTLIDLATGVAAKVYADDGVTDYPSSVITGSRVVDGAGVVTQLEAGQYRFPLVALGNYRLQVEPIDGYRFPSSIAADLAPSLKDASWRLGTGSRGETFPVNFGPPVELDVPLDPRAGRLELVKQVTKQSAGQGDLVLYTVDLNNSDVSVLSGIRVVDDLPPGMRYRLGSARLISTARPNGELLPDPVVSAAGQRITFDLKGTAGLGAQASLAARARVRLSYVLQVSPITPPGRQLNTAQAMYTGGVSNASQVAIQIVDDLMSASALLFGRVAAQCGKSMSNSDKTGVAGVRIQLEDGRYAITDTTGMWHMESVQSGGHVVKLDLQSLPKGAKLVPCEDNQRADSSHNVWLRAGTSRRIDFAVKMIDSPASTTTAASVGTPITKERVLKADTSAPELSKEFWAGATPDPAIVFPGPGFLAMTPALGFSVKHSPQHRVDLYANGEKVSGFHFEGTKTQRDTAVSFWRAVPLRDGENTLLAKVYGAGNQLIAELTRTVEMPGLPVRAELVKEKSVLIANGTQPIRVVVKMFDARGKPARRGLIGPFEVRGNFIAQHAVGDQLRDPLSNTSGNAGPSGDQNSGQFTGQGQKTAVQEFVVGEQGLVEVVLQSSSNAGELTLRFPSFEHSAEREVKAWINAAQRDWILVGIAEGTVTDKKLRSALRPVEGAAGFDAETQGGRAAFYARGTVSGDFLLTMAYDTRSKKATPDKNLAQALKPDEYYLVYGDESSVQRDAVSSRKLYLRIERKQFYAMFGDFAVGMTYNQLARFDRVLNGVKTQSRFQLGRYAVEATGFVAQTGQRAVRDEIATDGTSGAYRLSQKQIEPGTDRLRLQVRTSSILNELIEERVLQRFIDYRIDYANGEIILSSFARPLSWSGNRVVLVAEYETAPQATKDWVAGGRIAASLGRSTLGVSAIHDGTEGKSGQLLGIDGLWAINEHNRVKLELAHSRGQVLDTSSGLVQTNRGGAYSAEYQHKSAQLEARLFGKHADSAFGIKSQQAVELGSSRLGAQVRYRLSPEPQGNSLATQSSITAETIWSSIIGQTLNQSEVRFEQENKSFSWFAGVRSSRQVTAIATDENTQASVGATVRSEDKRLALRAETQQTLSGAAFGSAPNRYLLGWDYALSPQTSLLIEQLWLKTPSDSAALTRFGVKYLPSWGGEWSVGLGQARSSLGTESALGQDSRPLMSLGYQQRWAFAEHWSANLGFQKQRWAGSDALLQKANPGSAATALDSYNSAAMGLQYSKDLWSVASTIEGRWGDNLSRNSVGLTAFRKHSAGVALAAGLSVKNSQELGVNSREINARYAQAYRPLGSAWSTLHRLDWTGTQTDASSGVGPSLTASSLTPNVQAQKVVSNLHVNYYRPDLWQVSVHHGMKYSNETLQGSGYKGFTNFAMIEARKPVMAGFDFGVHLFGAHNNSTGIASRGYGLDLGYELTRDARVTLGWNRRGLHDGLYNEASWSRAGFYLRLQMRFDETSFKSNADASLLR